MVINVRQFAAFKNASVLRDRYFLTDTNRDNCLHTALVVDNINHKLKRTIAALPRCVFQF